MKRLPKSKKSHQQSHSPDLDLKENSKKKERKIVDNTKESACQNAVKRSETTFTTREANFRAYLEGSPVAIFVANQEGNYEYVNGAACKLIGYDRAELLQMNVRQLVPKEDLQKRGGHFERLKETGHSVDELRLQKKDGQIIWVRLSAGKMPDGKLVGFCEDITESKNAKEELAKQEMQYRLLAENARDVIWTMNLKGQFTYVSPSVFQLRGYTPEEVLQQSISEVLAPDSLRKVLESFKLFNETGIIPSSYMELEQPRKDGSTVFTEVNFTPLSDKDGKPVAILGVSRDISGRRAAEMQLSQSEKRARAIVENAPIGIATSGRNSVFLSANPAFCKILGYTEEELQHLTFKDITHPDDLKASMLKMNALEEGKIDSFIQEKRYLRKNGTIIYGRVMVSTIRGENGKPCLFIAELEDITEQTKMRRRIDEHHHTLEALVERRTKELKEANQRLLKSERLAAIGEFSGMVGHDLRNPLTGIKNAAYYLKKKGISISEADLGMMLEIIEKGISHSDKIISDLLGYSGEMHLKLENSHPKQIVKDAIDMARIPHKIKTKNNIRNLPTVKVDKNKLERVFLNLLENAVDAMPRGGTITLSGKHLGENIEISVADTGVGIPNDIVQKLFSPLVTTKAQGMGFGLAICKRIVDAHGGKIDVRTTKDKGTTFTVTLPIEPKFNFEYEENSENLSEPFLSNTMK
jgi:PAS domain S-box-containing protein